MPLAPGRQVNESLRLVRLLGKGGMGSVWIADHLGLQAQVAVKFMSAAAREDPTLLGRFEREAVAAAQIKSPHVVQTLDHGVMEPEGAPFIVMELLEGEDLMSRLKRLGRASVTEVAAVLAQAGKALQKAHAAGIIHRDIKPDNLFLLDADGDMFVKVLDFGVAKQAADRELGMTSTGSTVGTPHYMSPEQLLSAKHVDHRCDLWALGVVAYRMLTAELPFRGETLGALSVSVHMGVFAPPSKHRPDLGPAIDAWFARALHRDIDARFTNVKEMVDAFEQAARLAHPSGAFSGAFAGQPPAPGQSAAQPSPSYGGSSVTHAGSPRARRQALLLGGSITFLLLSLTLCVSLLVRAFAPRSTAEVAAAGSASSASAPELPASATPSAAAAPSAPASPIVNEVPTGSASAPSLPTVAQSAPRADKPAPLPRRKERDRGF
ncbi:MAG: serine/threonine-protein kinase [Byssovorax sp.]